MSTRPRIDASVIVPIDLGDQPMAPYVFIIEGLLGPRNAFSIDTLYTSAEEAIGRRGGKDVIRVPVRAPWCVVTRDVLQFTTVTESATKRKADDVAQAALEHELYPEMASAVQEKKPLMSRYDSAGGYA